MFFNYRITKYNPKYRNKDGKYLNEEWTSYYDIGKKYDTIFTFDTYVVIETKYIQSIIEFMNCNFITRLKVIELEKNTNPLGDPNSTPDMATLYTNLKDGFYISIFELDIICKLLFREYIWCKLESKIIQVHFWYDYYLYIMSKQICDEAIIYIQNMGLFVEKFDSPYL